MSTRKKTPQLPRVPLTDMDTHIGVTDLDTIYGRAPRQGRAEADPLAELDRQETMDAVQELRDLQKQRKMLEYKKRIEKLKEETGSEYTEGGGLSAVRGMYNFSATDLQAIAAMPPEERQKFMETLREINLMSSMGGGGGKVNPIMQLAMMGGLGGGGRQQGLTAKDVIELQQTMNQIYQTAGGGNKDRTEALTMKLLTETLPSWQNQAFQAQNQAYQTQIQALKENQSDPMRDIKYIKDTAGLLGLGPATQDKEVALARMQMEDRWKLEEFKFRREELSSQKLLGTVKQILDSVGPDAIKAMTRQQVGEQFRQPPQPQQPSPALPAAAAGAGKTQLMEVLCPNPQCKGPDGQPTRIYAPASATQVTCQSCGNTYPVKLGA